MFIFILYDLVVSMDVLSLSYFAIERIVYLNIRLSRKLGLIIDRTNTEYLMRQETIRNIYIYIYIYIYFTWNKLIGRINIWFSQYVD